MYESVRLGRTLVRLAGAGLCVVALAAADPPPAGNLNDAYRDLQLTVHVRRALREDESLGSVNVGVRVRDGVAILWGPVPSAEVVARALARVQTVQGILGVRNETYIALPDRNLEPIPIPLIPPDPQRSASASPDPMSGSLNSLNTAAREAPDDGAAGDPPQATGRHGIASSSPEAPTADHTPRARPVSRPAPASGEGLAAAVARLRTGDARFRGLRVDVKGATVEVAGAAEREEDVMALARLISRLPGVERVVTKTAGGAP
jgi:osmotically-inducible protein OsmY